MIGVVSTLATGLCQNCGRSISLLKSDLEKDPHWSHDPHPDHPGKFRDECPGTRYAFPSPNHPVKYPRRA